jgi:hypothetical protein
LTPLGAGRNCQAIGPIEISRRNRQEPKVADSTAGEQGGAQTVDKARFDGLMSNYQRVLVPAVNAPRGRTRPQSGRPSGA